MLLPARHQAQDVASCLALANVLASLSVTSVQDLNFGDCLQGVAKSVLNSDAANAGIFQVTGEEGAAILEISEEAYRKRLERSRKKIGGFLSKTCGLVNSENPCRCENMIDFAIETQWIDPENLFFANHPCKEKKCKEQLENLHEFTELGQIASLYRNQPEFIAPSSFTDSIRELVASGRYQLL